MIAPSDVVGRDRLIANIWRILDQQSAQLISERRTGKTSVVRKMVADGRRGFVCTLRDLESLKTIPEFVEAAYEDSALQLSKKDRVALGFRDLFGKLSGGDFQIGSVKLPNLAMHWKKLLTTLVEDICKDEKRRIVFFWDELPLFVHKLKPDEAMEFLDVLRGLRQTHANLRMVFTGSVGLHLVLTKLQRHGYANAPVNDMHRVGVDPLSPSDGRRLATALLDGDEKMRREDVGAAARVIADAAGCVPFYIHRIVNDLAMFGEDVTVHRVEETVQRILTSSDDPAELRYFWPRFDTYYERADATLARSLLTALARADGQALPFAQWTAGITDAEVVHHIVDILQQDHYIVRDGDGYRFRSPLVQRWWRENGAR
ncbi:MAG: ATP-binding protein [Acidobacteria bacterium]|nr:ATP-binding protein [Acidobacteriota bacterium]